MVLFFGQVLSYLRGTVRHGRRHAYALVTLESISDLQLQMRCAIGHLEGIPR